MFGWFKRREPVVVNEGFGDLLRQTQLDHKERLEERCLEDALEIVEGWSKRCLTEARRGGYYIKVEVGSPRFWRVALEAMQAVGLEARCTNKSKTVWELSWGSEMEIEVRLEPPWEARGDIWDRL